MPKCARLQSALVYITKHPAKQPAKRLIDRMQLLLYFSQSLGEGSYLYRWELNPGITRSEFAQCGFIAAMLASTIDVPESIDRTAPVVVADSSLAKNTHACAISSVGTGR